MADKQKFRKNNDAPRWVRANLDEVIDLPAPGTRWVSPDVDVNPRLLSHLRNIGIIRYTGERENHVVEGEYVSERMVYETTSMGHEVIERYRDARESTDGFLPCASDGCAANAFTTTSEGIECRRCGEVHDRGEIEI